MNFSLNSISQHLANLFSIIQGIILLASAFFPITSVINLSNGAGKLENSIQFIFYIFAFTLIMISFIIWRAIFIRSKIDDSFIPKYTAFIFGITMVFTLIITCYIINSNKPDFSIDNLYFVWSFIQLESLYFLIIANFVYFYVICCFYILLASIEAVKFYLTIISAFFILILFLMMVFWQFIVDVYQSTPGPTALIISLLFTMFIQILLSALKLRVS